MARCFNIIDSVKGGSGKSSLALMLSLACSTGYSSQAETAAHPMASFLLDMDFQGSSFSHLVFGNSALGEHGQAKQYINQKLLQYYRSDSCDYISQPVFRVNDAASPSEVVKYYQIAVAFASPNIPDRFRFKAVSHHNYSLQITYSTFREGVRRLLDNLDKEMALGNSLEYVFFDMPPNSNGYSDAVSQLLLSNAVLSTGQTTPRVNYFELTTLDRGHIESTLQWFEDFIQNSKQRFPDNFFFVLSNTNTGTFKDSHRTAIIQETIQMMMDRVKRILSNSRKNVHNRIFFIGASYQTVYHELCCTSSFILDQTLPLSIVTPISFYQAFSEKNSIDHNATEWLIQRMRGDA